MVGSTQQWNVWQPPFVNLRWAPLLRNIPSPLAWQQLTNARNPEVLQSLPISKQMWMVISVELIAGLP